MLRGVGATLEGIPVEPGSASSPRILQRLQMWLNRIEIHASLDRAWRVSVSCDDSFALHVFRRRAPDLHTSFCFVGSKVDLMLIVQWIPRSVPVSSIASARCRYQTLKSELNDSQMLWLFLLHVVALKKFNVSFLVQLSRMKAESKFVCML